MGRKAKGSNVRNDYDSPATGISLPFFSYGGTALAVQLAEMGVVLSVSRQIPAPKGG